MPDPLMETGTKVTPQSGQAKPEQVQNNAGGFTFSVPRAARAHRFLTLGSDGGTYYVKERPLTKENAGVITSYAREDASSLVQQILDVSVRGRAPRNNPALYALAAASALGDDAGRRAAFDALHQVARIGTHMYLWAGYRELFGGWGRGCCRAVGNWYLRKSPDELADQLIKYRQRAGWRHKDLLILSHPKAQRRSDAHARLFSWVVNGDVSDELPSVVSAYLHALDIEKSTEPAAKKGKAYVSLVRDTPGFPWEALPDEALKSRGVWEALIANRMPMTALLRKLPVLTNIGALEPMSQTLKDVCAQLADRDALIKARVHPVSILIALKTYSQGRGMRGDNTWTPVPQVIDALNDAFYLAYAAVVPSGKRTMLALDVSGSMVSEVAGIAGLSCREATAALALVTASTEKDYLITGFTSANGRGEGISGLNISPRQRLDDAVSAIAHLPFGGTDCSLPMIWAEKNKVKVDTFQVYTDNETWAGRMHPHQALERYRQSTGIPARLAVVSMTPTSFSIADPDDPGSLDVCGFDSAIPGMLADFSRGDI